MAGGLVRHGMPAVVPDATASGQAVNKGQLDAATAAFRLPRVGTATLNGQTHTPVATNPIDQVDLTLTGSGTVALPSGTPQGNGQTYLINALASGASRSLTFASGYRTTAGVGRNYTVSSGEMFVGAVKYSSLLSAWVIVAGTVTAT